jgi:hypothetical protein
MLSDLKGSIVATLTRLKDDGILKFSDRRSSPGQLAGEMLRILEKELSSDREQYLLKRLARLESINYQRDILEQEARGLRPVTPADLPPLYLENQQLRQQCEVLRTCQNSYQSSIKASNDHLLLSLEGRFRAFQKLQIIRRTGKSLCNGLRKDAADLRASVSKGVDEQLATLKKAKTHFIGLVRMERQQGITRQLTVVRRRTAKAKRQLQAVASDRVRIESLTKTILQTVWDLLPEQHHPHVSTQEFPDNMDKVIGFIECVGEYHRRREARQFQAEITEAIPEFRLHERNEPLSLLIPRFLDDVVHSRTRECELLVERGRKSEARLRKQLAQTLERIAQLRMNADEVCLTAGFDENEREWDRHRLMLDQTMEALERERDSSSSFLRDSESFLKAITSDPGDQQS